MYLVVFIVYKQYIHLVHSVVTVLYIPCAQHYNSIVYQGYNYIHLVHRVITVLYIPCAQHCIIYHGYNHIHFVHNVYTLCTGL